MNSQPRIYTISLLNDLHYHFPELLYRPERFETVQDVLRYISGVASHNPYERNREAYLRTSTSSPPSVLPPRTRRAPLQPASSPLYNHPPSSLFGSSLLSPLSSNVRINIPVSSSVIPVSSSSTTMSDQLVNSLLGSLLGGNNSGSSGISDLYFQILQQSNESEAPTQEEIQRSTSIPTIHHVIDGTCSICQDPCLQEGPACRRINHCGHLFHRTCIDTWFQTHSTCPMCRYDIRND